MVFAFFHEYLNSRFSNRPNQSIQNRTMVGIKATLLFTLVILAFSDVGVEGMGLPGKICDFLGNVDYFVPNSGRESDCSEEERPDGVEEAGEETETSSALVSKTIAAAICKSVSSAICVNNPRG